MAGQCFFGGFGLPQGNSPRQDPERSEGQQVARTAGSLVVAGMARAGGDRPGLDQGAEMARVVGDHAHARRVAAHQHHAFFIDEVRETALARGVGIQQGKRPGVACVDPAQKVA